jgi:ABC-2 type transport system permease protein
VGFPILLLAIFGSLPATTKPDAALGGLSFFEVYLPVMIALCLGLLVLIGLPAPITSYRELGVIRRMATTPVPPSWLLGAQVVVNLVLLLVASSPKDLRRPAALSAGQTAVSVMRHPGRYY